MTGHHSRETQKWHDTCPAVRVKMAEKQPVRFKRNKAFDGSCQITLLSKITVNSLASSG